MIVQKVRTICKAFLEIGRTSSRLLKSLEEWKSFSHAVTNKEHFSVRLLTELQFSTKLLEQDGFWMKKYIQFIVDTNGRIIHYDLDRGYNVKVEDVKGINLPFWRLIVPLLIKYEDPMIIIHPDSCFFALRNMKLICIGTFKISFCSSEWWQPVISAAPTWGYTIQEEVLGLLCDSSILW